MKFARPANFLSLLLIACANPPSADRPPLEQDTVTMPAFDDLWDFSNPAATEAKFRELWPQAEQSGDRDYQAQLLSQIARSQGLQREFDAAHATLDTVEGLLAADMTVARLRYLLERGRVFNSAGDAERAATLFMTAWELGRDEQIHGYAVDAAHMLAIAEREKAMEWNLIALSFAEASDDPAARRWLGSLYNNIGWTWHGQGEFERALDMFEKALAVRVEQDSGGGDGAMAVRIAKWCVARALRSLERHEQALAMQRALELELETAGQTDGFVHEELGELLLLLGKPEAAGPQFARAWVLLSADANFAADNAERLERMKALSE